MKHQNLTEEEKKELNRARAKQYYEDNKEEVLRKAAIRREEKGEELKERAAQARREKGIPPKRQFANDEERRQAKNERNRLREERIRRENGVPVAVRRTEEERLELKKNYTRNWRERNKEHLQEYERKRERFRDPEVENARLRAYSKTEKGRIANYKRNKRWRDENPEKCRARVNRYYRTPKGKLASHKSALVRRERINQISDIKIDNQFLEAVKEKFENICFNCGSNKRLSIDHHKPLSKGYCLEINNAVLLCTSCNCKKSNKLPEQFYSKSQLDILKNRYNIF